METVMQCLTKSCPDYKTKNQSSVALLISFLTQETLSFLLFSFGDADLRDFCPQMTQEEDGKPAPGSPRPWFSPVGVTSKFCSGDLFQIWLPTIHWFLETWDHFELLYEVSSLVGVQPLSRMILRLLWCSVLSCTRKLTDCSPQTTLPFALASDLR